MSETVTNELILKHLKRIQSDLSSLRADVTEIKADNRAHRALTAAVVQNEEFQSGQIATIQNRLDRIERRLDLTDAHAE